MSQIIGRRFRWLGRGIVSDHRLTISACRGGRGVPDHRSVISLSMRGGCHGLTISACRGAVGGSCRGPAKGPEPFKFWGLLVLRTRSSSDSWEFQSLQSRVLGSFSF